MRGRALAGRLAVAVLVAASAWCFADGWAMRTRRPSLLACVEAVPASWTFDCPAELRFERFLRQATRELPAGARLAVAGPVERSPQEAFYAMWASYLLPTHSVYYVSDGPPPAKVDYVLAYGRRLEHPLLEMERRVKGGRLYRVRHDEGPR